MNKKNILINVLVFILGFASAIILFNCNEVPKNQPVKTILKDYIDVIDDHNFYYANLIDLKDGYYVIASPGCVWCQRVMPILAEYSSENDERIGYINSSSLEEDDIIKLEKLLDEFLDEKKNIYTPTIFFIEKKKVINIMVGGEPNDELGHSMLPEVKVTLLKNISLLRKTK